MKHVWKNFWATALVFAMICTIADIVPSKGLLSNHANAADTAAKYRIMPLGDSITAGYCPGSDYEFGGYRMYLANLLEENELSDRFDFVGKWNTGVGYDMDNNGTNGVMIANNEWGDSILKDVETNGILQTYQPDIILLQIGTNDILGQSEKKELREYSKIGERLDHLIDTIFAHAKENVTIFLASIPSMEGRSYEKYNQNVSDYNWYIRKTVKARQEKQQNIYFVNINGAVSTGQYVDGVHPNQAGYSQMGSLWYKTITDYLYNNDVFLADQSALLNEPEPTIAPTKQPSSTPSALPPSPTGSPAAAKPTLAPTSKPNNIRNSKKSAATKAGQKFTKKGITYKILSTGKSNTAQLCKISSSLKKKKNVLIPAKVVFQGTSYAVTEIGTNVFRNAKIQKITIGKNVRVIQKGAFVNCKKLKQIRLLGTAWKKTFSKVGSKTSGVKFVIPKAQKKRYKALIKKAGFPKYKIS